jgi:patatin-like phospholipase/acyl hydrolase
MVISPARSGYSSKRRRERLPWPTDRSFRILSIDGGGIKGIFPAKVLSLLEAQLHRPAIHHFDMITGTSTGGILALGLAHGRPASELLDIYLKDGEQIFPQGRLRAAWRAVRGLGMYQYDRAALSAALVKVFGNTQLFEARTRLCIPSFEGHHGEVYIFKTPHHPDYRLDGSETMTTAGEATSAAPCFFRALDSGGYRFVDGGLWANNPVMIGIVDALACFDITPPQIQVLSIGCGREPVTVGGYMAIGGLIAWRNAIYAAMDLQSQNALGQARLLLGADRVTRLEPSVTRPIALDDWRRASAELPREAERAVETASAALQTEFFRDRVDSMEIFWPPRK